MLGVGNLLDPGLLLLAQLRRIEYTLLRFGRVGRTPAG